jgi:hypothetical protein
LREVERGGLPQRRHSADRHAENVPAVCWDAALLLDDEGAVAELAKPAQKVVRRVWPVVHKYLYGKHRKVAKDSLYTSIDHVQLKAFDIKMQESQRVVSQRTPK